MSVPDAQSRSQSPAAHASVVPVSGLAIWAPAGTTEPAPARPDSRCKPALLCRCSVAVRIPLTRSARPSLPSLTVGMRQRRLRMNQAFPAPGVPRLQPHRPSERTPASLIWVPRLFACRVMHHAHLSSCPAARLAQLLRMPHGLPQSLAPLRSFPACCNPNLAEEVIMCSLCQPVECIEWAAPASSYQVPSVRCACTQCSRSGVDQAPPTHCTQMLQCWQS